MCENSNLNISILSDKKDINKIVEIHMNSFPNFFLTILGRGFLKQLYESYYKDEDSEIIVCKKKTVIVGFIAYSNNYSKFYRKILRKGFIKFGFYAFFAFLKNPKILRKLLSALKKSESVKSKNLYVELASIAVDTKFQGEGIGRILIEYFKESVDYKKYKYINLETDAIKNEKVNKFYINHGFRLYRQYEAMGGRLMNEYRYYGETL